MLFDVVEEECWDCVVVWFGVVAEDEALRCSHAVQFYGFGLVEKHVVFDSLDVVCLGKEGVVCG